MRKKLKAKLLSLLISMLLMTFGLNYGWADRVDDLIKQLKDNNALVRMSAADSMNPKPLPVHSAPYNNVSL